MAIYNISGLFITDGEIKRGRPPDIKPLTKSEYM